ncbi:MAG: alpha-amylase domain-containing protein [Flavobacteriales bacterium]
MKKLALVVVAVLALHTCAHTQTTVKKVVLQAFWWDYHNNAYTHKWCNYLTELAPRLKAMGIDAVWIPPACKNESQSYVGYAPFDHYDLGDKYQKGITATRLGTKDELLRMIAVMHANGIEVIQDVVLNHMNSAGSANGSGGQDPNSYSMANNNGYKNFRYVCYAKNAADESQNNYWNRNGRWYKNYWNFYPNPNNNCTTGDICSAYFGADISYENNATGTSSNVNGYNPTQQSGYMRNGGRNWLMWMKKQTAVDGFRWDAVKHFPAYVQEDYSYNTKYLMPEWVKGGNNMFNVGEWVGSKSEIDAYVNAIAQNTGEKMMGTFDFNLRGFDPAGGLYGMVYGMGNFDMSTLPSAQQNERVTFYAGTNTYVHRTVPFVNNHDTFRPTFDSNGNYNGWNGSQELSPHIEPNEPRMSTAYAVIMGMDGNPQIFFEDLFDIGYNSNRWTHDPKSASSLPVRDDLANLIWCHQNLNFKVGPYMVPHTSADYLIIERAGQAIIGTTDNWDTWQTEWIHTSFEPGTVLKDYSGANGEITVTVDENGWALISTPPVNPALNVVGRHGYSVWAPKGSDGLSYQPLRQTTTTQEWEMANDLGDSHIYSLGQGGAIPASSTNFRVAGKVYVEANKQVTYILYPENGSKSLYIGLYNNAGTMLTSKSGTGTLTGYYTPNFTGWITLKVRNNVATNPMQKCWVNVTYTAPQTITNANNAGPWNTSSFWNGNGGDSNWNNAYNWEEGKIPDELTDAFIAACAYPQPAISGAENVANLFVEAGAHLFIYGELYIANDLINEGTITGTGSYNLHDENHMLWDASLVQFEIFPNPGDGELNIQCKGLCDAEAHLDLKLYSTDGKLLAEMQANTASLNVQMNEYFNRLRSGVYVIHIAAPGSMSQTIRYVRL